MEDLDCECGCHGSQISAGPFSLFIYFLWNKDGSNGSVILKDQHGCLGSPIGQFSSYKEAYDAARSIINDKVIAFLCHDYADKDNIELLNNVVKDLKFQIENAELIKKQKEIKEKQDKINQLKAELEKLEGNKK